MIVPFFQRPTVELTGRTKKPEKGGYFARGPVQ
jgi:hypothetical protein